MQCYKNTDDCTYAACQSGLYFDYLKGCQKSFQAKHPSAKQFLNPETVNKCRENDSDCTKDICNNSDFENYGTCKTFKAAAAERAAEAARKAAEAKKAAEEERAREKAQAEAIANAKGAEREKLEKEQAAKWNA